MIYDKDSVRYGTTTIPYHIIKTRRRVKTSEVIVDADTATITVRTSLKKDKHEIQRIVLDKASWILQKQREYRENKPQIIKPTFKQNSTLPYLGKNYNLVIKKNRKSQNKLQFINAEFVATIRSSSKNSRTLIKNLYESWLLTNAQITLKEKVEEWSQKMGITIERINIKNLRIRWASLTKDKKTINLNLHLLKAPDDVINYIILHELCHVKINGHSHHYWDLVRRYMPNYKEKIDWLNANTTSILDYQK